MTDYAMDYTAKAGDELTLTFNEMASAGYIWSTTYTGGLKIKKTNAPVDKDAPIGGSHDVSFIIEANIPGVHEINFTHKRPFEADPAQSLTFTLTIEPK